ncbi:GNAT family N-acetyltransferase, partial [Patescibacteria group bacterium]
MYGKFAKYIVETDPLQWQICTTGYGEVYTETLLQAIADKDGKIYFAEVDNAAVGCIAGHLQSQSSGGTLEVVPSKPAWIRELYIIPAYRGKGIGSLLMSKLEEYFKTKGCDIVQVGVFAPNTETREFYSTKGYVDREITMLK